MSAFDKLFTDGLTEEQKNNMKKDVEAERKDKRYSEKDMVAWPDDADAEDVKEFFENKE